VTGWFVIDWHRVLFKEVVAQDLSLLPAGRDKRGEASVAEGSATGSKDRMVLRSCIGEFGLISEASLFHDCEAGNAIERIRLHFESDIGDLFTTATTDSVRTLMQGRECLLNPTKLFDGTHLHGPRDIKLMVCGGLVGGVGEEFRFCRDQMGDHAFMCEHRSKLLEFALKLSILRASRHLEVRVFRWNISRDTLR